MTLHTNGLKSEAPLGVTSAVQISFFTTTFEAIWYELSTPLGIACRSPTQI